MARLRIPGGQFAPSSSAKIAHVAKELTTGYVQITTRANFQIRLIQPKDAPEVLAAHPDRRPAHARRGRGQHPQPHRESDRRRRSRRSRSTCSPFCHELAQIIINDRAFYDLPRKFNIAYDGGGLIGTVEDTNDIGAKAVKVGERSLLPHRARRRDRPQGLRARPRRAGEAGGAESRSSRRVVRVYIANGNRSDRKKARLKHLLEKWTLEQYLARPRSCSATSWSACRSIRPQIVYPKPEASALARRRLSAKAERAELRRRRRCRSGRSRRSK